MSTSKNFSHLDFLQSLWYAREYSMPTTQYHSGDTGMHGRIPISKDNIVGFLMKAREGEGYSFQVEKSLLPYVEASKPITGPITAKHKQELAAVKKTAQEETEKEFKELGREDPKRLQRLKEENEETVNRARFLEIALIPHQEASAWFGDDAHLTKTHEFDDWKRATDLVLTMEHEGAPLHLAIDVTVSQHKIRDKVDEIERRIRDGYLTDIEYFKDPKTNKEERLQFVPRVILPMAPATLDELKEITVNFFSKEQGDKKRRAAAENSALAYAILDTFIRQLERYKKIAVVARKSRIVSRIDVVLDALRVRRDEREKISGPRMLDNFQRQVA